MCIFSQTSKCPLNFASHPTVGLDLLKLPWWISAVFECFCWTFVTSNISTPYNKLCVSSFVVVIDDNVVPNRDGSVNIFDPSPVIFECISVVDDLYEMNVFSVLAFSLLFNVLCFVVNILLLLYVQTVIITAILAVYLMRSTG